jgi:hypothetical protein
MELTLEKLLTLCSIGAILFGGLWTLSGSLLKRYEEIRQKAQMLEESNRSREMKEMRDLFLNLANAVHKLTERVNKIGEQLHAHHGELKHLTKSVCDTQTSFQRLFALLVRGQGLGSFAETETVPVGEESTLVRNKKAREGK